MHWRATNKFSIYRNLFSLRQKIVFMNNRLVLILFLLISTVSYSQVSLQWQFYGDTPEESHFIVADSHENVYTLGAYGGLRKYNHTGDTVFYNTDTTQYEAKAIDIDGNDNIVTVGTYFGTTQDYRILVQKFDTSGNKIWATAINTPNGNREFASAFTFDQINNIYLTGWDGDQFFGKFFTAKVSSAGAVVWTNSFPKNGFDPYYGLDIAVHDTNSVYATGFVDENGTTNDMLLVKYNSNGDTVWSRKFGYYQTFGGQWTTEDNGTEVETDQLGNVYVISKDIFGNHDVLIKYNPSGAKQWAKEVSLSPTQISFMSIQNNNIYMAGNADIGFGLTASLAIKMDLNGTVIFDSTFATKTAQIADAKVYNGGIVMTGTFTPCNGCNSDIVTMYFDSVGNSSWSNVMNTSNGFFTDQAYGLTTDNNGGIYITGNGNGSSYWMDTYKLFPCKDIKPAIAKNGNLNTANYIAGSTYTWRDCANDSIVAQGFELFQFVQPYPGNFAVEISVGTCSDTTSCIVANLNTIPKNENEYIIYPNPAVDIFNVIGISNNNTTATLYSADMREIDTFTLTPESAAIDLRNLCKGIYFLSITNSFSNRIIKLIKE